MEFVVLVITSIILHLKKKRAGESNWKLRYICCFHFFPSEKRGLEEATRKAGLIHVVSMLHFPGHICKMAN